MFKNFATFYCTFNEICLVVAVTKSNICILPRFVFIEFFKPKTINHKALAEKCFIVSLKIVFYD